MAEVVAGPIVRPGRCAKLGLFFRKHFSRRQSVLASPMRRSIGTAVLRDLALPAQRYRKKFNHGDRRGRGERLLRFKRLLETEFFYVKNFGRVADLAYKRHSPRPLRSPWFTKKKTGRTRGGSRAGRVDVEVVVGVTLGRTGRPAVRSGTRTGPRRCCGPGRRLGGAG